MAGITYDPVAREIRIDGHPTMASVVSVDDYMQGTTHVVKASLRWWAGTGWVIWPDLIIPLADVTAIRFEGGSANDIFSPVRETFPVPVRAFGKGGHDLLRGGAANDLLSGSTGNDVIEGRGGDDTIQGGSGGDTLYGGAGNDYMTGDAGRDLMDGGSGNDTVEGGKDLDFVSGGGQPGDVVKQ